MMKDSGYKWVGSIPDDWTVERLKGHFSFGKGLPITKDNLVEEGAAVISYGQIHSKTNTGVKVEESLKRFVSESYLNTNPSSLVNEGDFIFADTSEDVAGCGACVYVDKPQELFAGYHTIIARSLIHKDNKYFAYLFQTDNWRSQIREKVDGVKLFSTTQSILKQTYIILPPEEQKKKIADFLDTKCAEIQSAIDNSKQTIEEYKKLKQAVITKAVTKGIRENRKLKDSGSVWFSDVPEDWKTKRLKYVFYIKKDIAGKEGYDVLSITQRGIVVKDLSKNAGQLAADYSNYQLVNVGDFAMNHMDLLTGWVDISKYPGVTSPDYRVFQLHEPENNCARYYLYMMQMCYMDRIFYGLGQGVSGMGRWRLQADKFLNFLIVQPPKEEQQEIADYLDNKCSQIDELISKKEQFITELEKYKQSLIYEYVTGKKEVK